MYVECVCVSLGEKKDIINLPVWQSPGHCPLFQVLSVQAPCRRRPRKFGSWI